MGGAPSSFTQHPLGPWGSSLYPSQSGKEVEAGEFQLGPGSIKIAVAGDRKLVLEPIEVTQQPKEILAAEGRAPSTPCTERGVPATLSWFHPRTGTWVQILPRSLTLMIWGPPPKSCAKTALNDRGLYWGYSTLHRGPHWMVHRLIPIS